MQGLGFKVLGFWVSGFGVERRLESKEFHCGGTPDLALFFCVEEGNIVIPRVQGRRCFCKICSNI